ncbi:Phage P22-like portal protein [uncultured Caudovirales phage]|uniref:Phage P22-like portal protein n=1 Tax=uncultured Caudovirales phage TaxID=2100421 RepID=A0A6J5PM99_9CAUD|nr:Phage P22-like portal protein [uncultured Caudovirales phage]
MNAEGLKETGAMENGRSKTDSAIIDELKARMRSCIAADGDNHAAALSDLRFLKGDQWPEKQKQQRESEGRPVLTVNKLPTFLQQVTNDQRQNRSSIKVSPVSENASAKTAEIIQGMIRHMEYESAADVAYDTAVNSAAAIGFGYFRIVTEYCSPTSFDQELRVKRIRNPFTVYFDPASVEPDGSDAQFVIITEKIVKDEFKARYPNAQITIAAFDNRSGGAAGDTEWIIENTVRIAEYYRMEYDAAKLYMLLDGTITYVAPEDKSLIKQTRDSYKKKLMWYKATACEVLESTQIMCDWIPVFPVYGTEIDIDGKVFRAGLIRNAKDPAMMYNFWMTSATEEVSMRPKTPYIGAVGQFENQQKKWAQANNRSFPYLEYNPVTVDGQLAPPPSRQPMVDVPVGVLTMANHASDNIKSTTGLFDSSLGAMGNATSGKQELAQQKQGNVANYHYTDNFYRTLRHAGRCALNMVPHYYDSERLVEMRGEDDTVSHAYINKLDVAANQVINDIRVGKYQVAVSVGPSYATMRAEAADSMVQFGQSWPKLMDIAGDKVVKAMNWPGAEEIAERIGRTIPENIKNDPADSDTPEIPPEVQQRIAELETQIQELSKEADANHAKVTAEEIRKEAAIAVAEIRKEGASDVAELTGLVKILIAKMPPPPELASEVSQDLSKPESQQTESQGSTVPPDAPPMNDQMNEDVQYIQGD